MGPGGKIRVLVVDDSILARKVIMDGLSAYPNIEIAGYAINAVDAKNKVKQLRPDVMTLDVQMPGMTGLDFLKTLLPEYPLPVVLVSALNLGVFDALHAGAVDFVRKPDRDVSTASFIRTLAVKVQDASKAKVQHHRPAASAEGGTSGYLCCRTDCHRSGCVHRRHGSDFGSDETSAGGYSRHGNCSAYADGVYQNVCGTVEQTLPYGGTGGKGRG